MRKIISILLAVGLVLGMITAAAPVGAQPPPYGTDWADPVTVDVFTTDCEFLRGTYNISFVIPASLTEGLHTITVKFPEGTGYPASWRTGHIRIWDGSDWTSVFVAEITRDGDEVTFLSPIHYDAGLSLVIQFQPVTAGFPATTTGIINPAAGDYFLEVKTSRAPMSTYVKSGWSGTYETFLPYEIVPAVPSFKYTLDFGPTYDGIAVDFVPPFKACGQNGTDEPFETYYDLDFDRWVTNFTTMLSATTGCVACPDMSAIIRMTSRPTTTARAHLYMQEPPDAPVLAKNFTSTSAASDNSWFEFGAWASLAPEDVFTWVMGLHFDTVGTYTLSFELVYMGDTPCAIECETYIRPVDFVVHQWKDAAVIELDFKWNLFSLPIVPFDTSIESVLAPLAKDKYISFFDPYLSIWHYDRCANSWATYGNGQTSLETIEDGKAYWMRMRKPGESYYKWFTFPVNLWVFGLKAPKAPSSPSAYPVCPGWNMVGFRSTVDMDESLYLWSVAGDYSAGAIYGWNAGAVQDWFIVGATNDLEVGLGYWIPFIDYGEIYPPLP